MSVTTTTVSTSYNGNGLTTTFAVPFFFLESTDLDVALVEDGVTTDQTLGSSYTVSGSDGDSNRSITFTTAPTATQVVSIERATPLTQPTSFRSQGTFHPRTHETAFDRATLQAQETRDFADGWYQEIRDAVEDLNSGSHAVTSASSVLAYGSTTPRTLTIRFSERVNVRDYGAVGDGVTNDTAAIQAAIDSISATGGVVELLPGTYRYSKLRIYGGVTLAGAGMGVTTLKLLDGLVAGDRLSDDGGPNHLDYGGVPSIWTRYGASALEDIGIRDLTLDGNWANQTYAGAKKAWGIYLNQVTRARIERVRATGFLNHGICLKEATYCLVSDCVADTNGQDLEFTPPVPDDRGGGDGIVLISRCSDNLVIGCHAYSNRSIGFEDEGRFDDYNAINRNKRNRWIACRSYLNHDHGFLGLFTDFAQYVGCISEEDSQDAGASSAGFKLVGTTDCTATNLKIKRPSKDGIRVEPESFGAIGRNYRVAIDGEITDTARHAAYVNDCAGGRFRLHLRGIGGPFGVAFDSTASTGIDLSVDYDGTVPATYAVGQAYAVGTIRKNGNRIYRLDEAFTGSGLSVTAPTGYTTSDDNGGRWVYLYRSDVPDYAIYGLNMVEPSIHDTSIKACADHNIFLDGTTTNPSLVNVVSTDSAARGLEITTISGAARFANVYLASNTSALNLTNLAYTAAGCVGLGPKIVVGSAAPVSGTWVQGDIVWNSGATAGGTVGWVCTTGGTPGTWKTFGAIAP